MTSILIVYGTGEGQTAKVAAFVESVLADRGFDVTTRHVFETDDADIEAFDAVLVGSSVNNRAHRPEVVAFVERHRETLATLPTGFFQLSLASAVSTKWARDGALGFVDGLTESTGWAPDRVGLFAGALTFSRYGRAQRTLFKLAAIVMGLDGDTTRDYEYTDWADVERFAVEFGEFVEREVAEHERSCMECGHRARRTGRSAVRSVALSARRPRASPTGR
ncbi:flavodoxin domain-containing protein [Halogeometricum luteum]|uniref:Protoporphyrinogen oxidase n=1 Tax=Halogeometricum luteum TaxID=2950537 RepID=A0ABU2G068_9EURY|nr:flavodoxin domain-containing protein [Halogeometricum sp. S3BR5-2]MDS0293668.1 protoporphyrinogen oxidase [Halogeometricum sp. S3BR5-2]